MELYSRWLAEIKGQPGGGSTTQKRLATPLMKFALVYIPFCHESLTVRCQALVYYIFYLKGYVQQIIQA